MQRPRNAHEYAQNRFADRDPMGKVLDLGRRISVIMAIALAFMLHAGFAAAAANATLLVDILKWNRILSMAIKDKLTQEYEITEEKPPEPPPPPPPEPEPVKEVQPVVKQDLKEPEPPPPPAPAQAAAVMTQEQKPDEPVDLTGDTFVSGTGDGTSFGAVSAQGKGQNGVYAKAARVEGVPGGTGTAPAPPPPPPQAGPDRSRKASPGSADWNDCGFPPEADAEQIDEQYVQIRVNVDPAGKPTTVTVVSDPGHGFGRLAKQCAMRKSFVTALDHDGNAIAGQTTFNIHFQH